MSEIFANPENFQKALKEAQNAPKGTEAPIQQENVSEDALEADNQHQEVEHEEGQEEEFETDSESEAQEAGEQEETERELDDQEVKGHLIPKSRFNKEIEKRKSLEKSLQEEREARIRMEERMEAIRQLEEKSKQIHEKPQEVELDPLDSDAHNYYVKQINELKQELQSLKGESQSTKQMNYVTHMVEAQERAFAAEHPDFQDALNHLQKVEMEVAKDFFDTPEEAQAYVAQKLQGAILTSAQKGKNAAEMMYNMAKKYGYSNKKAAPNVPKRNVEAINRNMDKSVSIRGSGNAANLAGQGMASIEAAFRKQGDRTSGVDSDKFHELLKRAQANRY